MPKFLVEAYLERSADRSYERRAKSAAEALTNEGTSVRFIGSIHVPTDEICLITFDAGSDAVALDAARRAGLEPIRVVAAVPSHRR